MFRSLKADKDTYVTDKFVDGIRAISGNVGIAGSLDLFKLYGITTSGSNKTPLTELSRILLHFDLDPLRSLSNSGKIDIGHPSFKCHLNLKDVYGGQTTPNEFTVSVFPLSASFDEGFGKDTAYFFDKDVCNFLSSSKNVGWFLTGCGLGGGATTQSDYITSSLSIPNIETKQYFKTGEEDLNIDVTQIISATLSGELPDSGFRLSFTSSLETDVHTYFVKRFGSRHSFDETKRPRLLMRFDDSIEDDTSNLYLDVSSSLFFNNYAYGQPKNLLSSSQEVTGSNCVLLELKTQVSGVGSYSLFFTGSQHAVGANYYSGIYSASIFVPSTDTNLSINLLQSGSVSFTPIWSSLDRTVSYLTGSKIKAHPQIRTSKRLSPQRFTVSVLGISTDYVQDQDAFIRVNLFDKNDPQIIAKKLPVVTPSAVVRNCYYAIRDQQTNEYIVPFDDVYNSTKVSSDSEGMYFTFNTSALVASRYYVIDLMILVDGTQQKYLNASEPFRIKKL
jgi:hypothetical protein